MVGASAVSSDTGVATVVIEDGNIAVTSVSAGAATITVSAAGYTPASIAVTVGANGVVTIGAITKGAPGGGGFVTVADITGIPASGTAGQNLTLSGTVTPENATNKTIGWTVKNAGMTGASITGNVLSSTGAGTVVVTAAIANGQAAGTDYTKDFTITLSPGNTNDPDSVDKFTGIWVNGSITLSIEDPQEYNGKKYFPFTLNYSSGTKTGSIADDDSSITFTGNRSGNDATYAYTLNNGILELTREINHGNGNFYEGIPLIGTYTKQP